MIKADERINTIYWKFVNSESTYDEGKELLMYLELIDTSQFNDRLKEDINCKIKYVRRFLPFDKNELM